MVLQQTIKSMGRRQLVTLACALLFSGAPRLAHATGQCSPQGATEQNPGRPDFLPLFAAGKLGPLRPDFPRAFLAVAYLTLSGEKLDAATQKQLVAYWLARNHTSLPQPAKSPPELWAAGLKKVVTLPPFPAINAEYVSGYCWDDAYTTALRTLNRLQHQPGVAPSDVVAWGTAQAEVFRNCDTDGQHTFIPQPLPAAAPAPLRAERDYQIAAARLYAGEYVNAAADFGRIAKDPTSPWAPWGTYLAARSHLRRSMIKGEPQGLKDARPLLEALSAQDSDKEMKRRARALLGAVEMRQNPGIYVRKLAAALHHSEENYVNDLSDYLLSLDLLVGDGDQEIHQISFAPGDLQALQKSDELTDWLLTLRVLNWRAKDSPGVTSAAAALEHSIESYQKTKSLPWLVAALLLVPGPSHPQARALMQAAAALPRTSPAYDTATYQLLSLLQKSPEKRDQAEFARRLDAELAARAAEVPSTLRNQLLDWRFELATTLDQALDTAERIDLPDDSCGFPQEAALAPPPAKKLTRHISDSFIRPLEKRAPLTRLEALLSHPKLPGSMRAWLVQMAYARALLLGENNPALRATIDRLEPLLRAQKGARLQPHLQALAAAKAPDERRFAIALMLLDGALELNPQMPAGVWCPPGDNWENRAGPHPELGFRVFSDEDGKQAEKELKELIALGGSLATATRWTLDYGKLHPEDARLPQTLYIINQQSRSFPCETTLWSKKAFLFMHKTYPQHPLTKKVKYWY